MSFAVTAVAALGVMAASAYVQHQDAKSAASAQKKANARALADSARTADLADQATNAANRKTPDLAALLSGNALTKGVGSTMLTGPQGVAPGSLTLGRNTLLGA